MAEIRPKYPKEKKSGVSFFILTEFILILIAFTTRLWNLAEVWKSSIFAQIWWNSNNNLYVTTMPSHIFKQYQVPFSTIKLFTCWIYSWNYFFLFMLFLIFPYDKLDSSDTCFIKLYFQVWSWIFYFHCDLVSNSTSWSFYIIIH